MADQHSPSYKNPPVVETVLGIQFEPLQGFCNAHLGAFWKQISEAWPHVSDAPTLEPEFEVFGDAKSWLSIPGIRMKISQDPSTRLRIRNNDRDRMVQVQNGRIHLNWLGHAGGEYPRFANVLPEFQKIYGGIGSFLLGLGLGEVKPNQWEVTYVNHIPKGTVWNTPADVGDLLPKLLAANTGISVGVLERQEAEWHFEIAPQLGRLHISLKHAKRSSPEPDEVLVLTLTARGAIRSDSTSIADDLKVGRRAIVEAFSEITSPQAQQYWEREI